MDILVQTLLGLLGFVLYFSIAIASLFAFRVLYTRVTPHDEMALVKDEKNTAASIALSGALIGFSIALAGAASNSVNLLDFIIWDAIAMGAQILAFRLVRMLMPKISERIIDNEVPAGILLAAFSLAIGVLNAGSMSY